MHRGKVPSATSNAQHVFSRAPQATIQRSKFNRSYSYKTTFDAGWLIPILVDEVLPGDTFNVRLNAFVRLNTPIFPIMDNLYFETFYFFVPNRLLWENWQRFNGERDNPDSPTDYTVPQIMNAAGIDANTLYDYMGIPTLVPLLPFNNLHGRAYNLIWNEWFRDENMQDSVVYDFGDGPDDIADYVLLKRGKRYDYFTSCLPFPQKGPDVSLPLGSTAPVQGNATGQIFVRENGAGGLAPASNLTVNGAGVLINSVDSNGVYFDWQVNNLLADLSEATAATINDLRLAFQTQKMYERDARGGTRYTEIIKSHFGVSSPDMRLQRPEYIGGSSTAFMINPVAQTVQEAVPTDKTGLGVLGAYGTCAPHTNGFTYSATEHGVIVGLCAVRADLNYQQGLERMWSRQTRFDFYWPALSHIGEQAVLNKEIYAQGTGVVNPITDVPYDDEVFGYQERYAEYRYKPSVVSGDFRSNADAPLDAWHLAQNFESLPALNDDFIKEAPPMGRIEAVPTSPDFKLDAFFSMVCARPMPVYGVPGLVDHF